MKFPCRDYRFFGKAGHLLLSMLAVSLHLVFAQAEDEKPRKNKGDVVSIMSNNHVAEDEDANDVVTIFGNTEIDGRARGDAVTIAGNLIMNGEVSGDTVVLLGNVHIDGKVGAELVCILGTVTLGPNAIIKQDMVIIGGFLDQHDEAVIQGEIHTVANGMLSEDVQEISDWMSDTFLKGRMISPSYLWNWYVAIGIGAFMLLLVIVVPDSVAGCVVMIEQRFLATLATGLCMVIVAPILVLICITLLTITVVGAPLVPIFLVGVFFCILLGYLGVYSALGRAFGFKKNMFMAFLLGSILITICYSIPLVGFLTFSVVGILGLGGMVIAFFNRKELGLNKKQPAYATARVSQPVYPDSDFSTPIYESPIPTMVADVAPKTGTRSGSKASVAAGEDVPVGFWLRALASLIDFMVIVTIVSFLNINNGKVVFICFVAYHVAFWMWKETTIGGVIFRLKLKRLDGKPVDFSLALIRSLCATFSLLPLGIGFFSANWNDRRQSWHDKIAGTVVVKMRDGESLLG